MSNNLAMAYQNHKPWRNAMKYEVMPDEKFPNEWRCEAIDQQSGDIYIAVFAGPDAEERAREYASWQQTLARAA